MISSDLKIPDPSPWFDDCVRIALQSDKKANLLRILGSEIQKKDTTRDLNLTGDYGLGPANGEKPIDKDYPI
jgi:hypothetical protein